MRELVETLIHLFLLGETLASTKVYSKSNFSAGEIIARQIEANRNDEPSLLIVLSDDKGDLNLIRMDLFHHHEFLVKNELTDSSMEFFFPILDSIRESIISCRKQNKIGVLLMHTDEQERDPELFNFLLKISTAVIDTRIPNWLPEVTL